jgi:hypothetical protein
MGFGLNTPSKKTRLLADRPERRRTALDLEAVQAVQSGGLAPKIFLAGPQS